MTFRRLKKQIKSLLQAPSLDQILPAVTQLPARQTISPLFSLLYHGDEEIRWRAVSAVGAVVAQMASEDLAGARVCMRRLMWQLNDESGGIGWGAPEAMGEIMARHKTLAEEYAPILVSYLAPWGNYLEHEPLQEGVLWALGRLGRRRPQHVQPAAPLLAPFLNSPHAALRGLSAWAAGPILTANLKPEIEVLGRDSSIFRLYWDGHIKSRTVAWAAIAALNRHNEPVI
jgi:hypothetical protein